MGGPGPVRGDLASHPWDDSPGGQPPATGDPDQEDLGQSQSLRATSGGVARAGGHSARDKCSDGDVRVTQQHRCHNVQSRFCSASPGRWGRVRGAWCYEHPSRGCGTDPCRGSVLCSWRSQPSGIAPTTSVGELNSIGEPKDPSVVHPPHSTVLRREERNRDLYTADRQTNILIHSFFYIYFYHFYFDLILCFSLN